MPADTSWVAYSFIVVIIGAVASWVIFELVDPKLYEPAVGISIFAPMYVIAQGIERLMEPFTKYLGDAADASGATRSKAYAVQQLETEIAAGNLTLAVQWQALLDQIRRNRAVITWAIASFVAMVLSGWFGFQLLRSTGLDAPGGIDVVITGLAIGSGTKPLHDLISNLQKSKNVKSDPSESATTR
jgi:hypothetical protein